MSFVLGLTGGIASGKSTVSRFFKEHQVPVIDADIAAREVVEPGNKGLNRIVETFGGDILEKAGGLDRKKLGQMVFTDKKKLEALNAILHPLIREKILSRRDELIKAKVPLIVLDIPLLYEAGYREEADAVMVVYVDKETQLMRLMGRDGISKKEADSRIQSQRNLEWKKEQADMVIDNTGSLEDTKEQIRTWMAENGYLTA